MHKVKIVFSVLLCSILCALGLSSCFSGQVQLYAPENLRIDGRTLTWDEVENASGYMVYIQDEVNETQETSCLLLDLTGPATYIIEVIALGDNINYSNSPRSTIDFTLEIPVEEGYDERGFKYTLLEDGTGYEVHRGKVGFNSEILRGEVYIPDFFNGYPVKRIAESAFSVFAVDNTTAWPPNPIAKVNCNTVTTSFRLPTYLDSVGEYAFYGCVEVEEFVLPESVTEIGRLAFKACGSLKRITLPTGLKEIPSQCFADCALEEITLPEGLERIGNSAFSTSLHPNYSVGKDYKARTNQCFTKIVVPDSVTYIGDAAFSGCVKLEDITLPSNLEYLGNSAFSNTAWYEAQPEGLVTIRGDILYGYKGDRYTPEELVIEIPSYIKYIADSALRIQYNVTEIIIPDGVKFLGGTAFSSNKALTYVRLPADLQAIPAQTFLSCTSLQHIDIPDSVTEIGRFAFEYTAIESIVIPASVTKIGTMIFNSSPIYGKPLKELFYKGTQAQWKEIEMGNNPQIDEATKYFYSETKPTVEGNYWHYVNGEVVVW